MGDYLDLCTEGGKTEESLNNMTNGLNEKILFLKIEFQE